MLHKFRINAMKSLTDRQTKRSKRNAVINTGIKILPSFIFYCLKLWNNRGTIVTVLFPPPAPPPPRNSTSVVAGSGGGEQRTVMVVESLRGINILREHVPPSIAASVHN